MWLDERLEFCDNTAVNTGGAATYNVGDVVDMTVARDIGVGRPLYLIVAVGGTGISTATSAGTIQFKLVSDATGTIATNGTATEHLTTAALATTTTTDAGTLAPGTILMAKALPMEGAAYERYLAIQQVTATQAAEGGTINAFLTYNLAKFTAYADAI